MSKKPSVDTEIDNQNETVEPALFDESGFCIAEGVKRIENNTERLINLPPIENSPDFPNGVKLWPGLSTVPNRYWEALRNYEPNTVCRCSADFEIRARYKPSTKRPGMDLIEYLLTPTKIVKADGIYFGPQISVFEPEQCDRPDGAPLPDSLAAYNDVTALKLIANVNNREVLARWAKLETDPRRAHVKEAAVSKLSGMR